MSADASVLLWNKKLFKQAGLDPEKGPTNWAEIEEYAGKVNALGGDIHGFYFPGACGGCNAFTFMPLVWASGGDILVDGGKRATLDTPQMRDAIQLYRDIVAKGYVPESAKTDAGANFFGGFATGTVGIAPSGAFAIGNLVKNYPDVEFGVTYLPGKTGGACILRGRRQLRRHGAGARTSQRSRSSCPSSIRSKARPCSPRPAACRRAATSPPRR